MGRWRLLETVKFALIGLKDMSSEINETILTTTGDRNTDDSRETEPPIYGSI